MKSILFLSNNVKIFTKKLGGFAMSKEIFDTFKFKSGAELKNRVLMAPMTIQAGYFDGSVTSEMIDYYQYRAGDASAIIVESCFVENHGRGFPGAIGIDNDDKIPGLKRLAEAIQAKDQKRFCNFIMPEEWQILNLMKESSRYLQAPLQH